MAEALRNERTMARRSQTSPLAHIGFGKTEAHGIRFWRCIPGMGVDIGKHEPHPSLDDIRTADFFGNDGLQTLDGFRQQIGRETIVLVGNARQSDDIGKPSCFGKSLGREQQHK